MADPMRREHDRARTTCEDRARAAARADGRRAAATRERLHRFPEGAAMRTGFLDEGPDDPAREKSKRRSS